MALHTVTGGVSAAVGSAGAGMLAVMHTDPVMVLFGGLTSISAIGGFLVAAISYRKHRNDQTALATHEIHDDKRFDRIDYRFDRLFEVFGIEEVARSEE